MLALETRKGIVANANSSEYTLEAYYKAAFAVFKHFFAKLTYWEDLDKPDYQHLLDFDNCCILMWNSIHPAFVWRPNHTDGDMNFCAADLGGPGIPTEVGNGKALGPGYYVTCPSPPGEGLCPLKSYCGYGAGRETFWPESKDLPCSMGCMTVMQIPLGDPKGVVTDRPRDNCSNYQGCVSRDGRPHLVWAVVNPSPGLRGHHTDYQSKHGEMAYMVGASKTLGDVYYRHHYLVAVTGDDETNALMGEVIAAKRKDDRW